MDVRGGFRLRLLGYQAVILPNPCSRVLHAHDTVGPMLSLSGSQ